MVTGVSNVANLCVGETWGDGGEEAFTEATPVMCGQMPGGGPGVGGGGRV